MRWPIKPRGTQRLCFALAGEQIAFVLIDAPPSSSHRPRILRWGALAGNAPAAGEVIGLLQADAYQILKVETPNVPADELKAATRWQFKDVMPSTEGDDFTLDVMHVGGDVDRPHRELFVITAPNRSIRALTTTLAGLKAEASIVDIQETALRNLLNQQMRRDQIGQRACAAVLVGRGQDMLVVCANDELHYTRRLEADAKLLERARGGGTGTTAAMPLAYEYQPGGSFEMGEAESPFIVELQRSFDVWDRSWPQLPLARLYVLSDEGSDDIAGLVQRDLGVQAFALDPLSGFASPPPAIEGGMPRAALLPLLGAALRVDERKA
jgi:MSHA biogenesis protein MshI